jgi:UPF0755 protein
MNDVRLSSKLYISLGAIIALGLVWAYALFMPVSLPEDGTVFYLKPGTPRVNVIKELSAKRLIRLAPLFKAYIYFYDAHFKSGEYHFAYGSTAYSIWKQITQGTGHHYRSFTIIPGWTFEQVKQALYEEETIKSITQTMSNNEIMTTLGDSEHKPEGMFMPETYFYIRDVSDLVILQRAYDLMQNKLKEAWEHRNKDLPYNTTYEALIAASLIEKEAYLSPERPKIGGVLINRLRKDMLLQFDPSVIYGMGDKYHGTIYKQDLVADTPYNTYIHKGLPPTPIAMPGIESIQAAMQPEKHEYLYFVARGDGSHEFSKTLEDHQDAVKKASEMQKHSFNSPLIRAILKHALLNGRVFPGKKRYASR